MGHPHGGRVVQPRHLVSVGGVRCPDGCVLARDASLLGRAAPACVCSWPRLEFLDEAASTKRPAGTTRPSLDSPAERDQPPA